MDDELRTRIETEAEKHALFNALKHGSDADVGAIMGSLMGENPEFREHGSEVPGIAGKVVAQMNQLDGDERRDRLEELDANLVEELEAEDEEDDQILPDLPNAEEYEEIRMRCAPNPNGPWHIGHGRMPAVIGTYKDLYDGEMLVRFDDTDPETKRPNMDAYDAILRGHRLSRFRTRRGDEGQRPPRNLLRPRPRPHREGRRVHLLLFGRGVLQPEKRRQTMSAPRQGRRDDDRRIRGHDCGRVFVR